MRRGIKEGEGKGGMEKKRIGDERKEETAIKKCEKNKAEE